MRMLHAQNMSKYYCYSIYLNDVNIQVMHIIHINKYEALNTKTKSQETR